MQEITSTLKSAGLKYTLLNAPFAFHSVQVDPVLEPLERIAENVKFKTPSILVISPLLAECIFDRKTLYGKYLSQKTREPVDFVRRT
jgi:acyl transferase domain-containing protein